jgi:hypothetical protein
VAAVQDCSGSKKRNVGLYVWKTIDKSIIMPLDNDTQEDKYYWMTNGIII